MKANHEKKRLKLTASTPNHAKHQQTKEITDLIVLTVNYKQADIGKYLQPLINTTTLCEQHPGAQTPILPRYMPVIKLLPW